MDKSESIAKIAEALLAAQKKMPSVKKSADNPFFKSKYAPLDKVMPVALAVLSENDIALTQLVSHVEGQSALITLLVHISGEWISATQPLVLDKENPQGQGSAITYARRYAIMSAIGMVADSDDDGNQASTPSAPRSVKTASVKQIQWMRDTAHQVNDQLGNEPDEVVDKWIEGILTMPPAKVPLFKVMDAINKLKEKPPKEDVVVELSDKQLKKGMSLDDLPY